MARRPSKRTLGILIAVIASVALILLIRASIWPADDSLVGSTETAVRARYGSPVDEFTRHYGAPTLAWTRQFKGEVKSATFWRLGGHVYVSFEKRNGQWIVICNTYLPRGGVF